METISKSYFYWVKMTVLLFVFNSSISIYGQLILNGDMELGANGLGVVPDYWQIISGSPDHCETGVNCGVPSPISLPSPQGGKWVRFFHWYSSGVNNETFGQQLSSPLIPGVRYKLSYYIAHTRLNSQQVASPTKVIVGFSNGMPFTVGLFHRDTSESVQDSTWTYFEHSFIADDVYDFISIGKLDIEVSNACYIDDVQLTTDFTGLESTVLEKYRVYPNPSTGTIQVEYGSLPVQQVELSDLSGKMIRQFQPDPSGNLTIFNLNGGAYFVRIIMGNSVPYQRMVFVH